MYLTILFQIIPLTPRSQSPPVRGAQIPPGLGPIQPEESAGTEPVESEGELQTDPPTPDFLAILCWVGIWFPRGLALAVRVGA